MPKIKDSAVLKILEDKFFELHVAMHLVREGLIQPTKLNFNMRRVDAKGSGKQFLDMHNELLRVFLYMLDKHRPKLDYKPAKTAEWDLDRPEKLPGEVHDLFRATNRPDYLSLVFKGVKDRVEKTNGKAFALAADDLGRFIERGDDKTPGSGFHDTLHQYLGSKEGGFAKGAEMNKLRASMNNDYFWQIHKWINGQYQRLATNYSKTFNVKPLSPQKAMMHMAGTKMNKKTMRPTKSKMGTMKMGKAAGK